MFSSFLVKAELGANITLPCRLESSDNFFFGSMGMRVKWIKIADDESFSEDVLISMGFHKRTYGSFEDRVFLVDPNSDYDASVEMLDISMEDMGKYHCEIISGEEEIVHEIILEVESNQTKGKCFYYHYHHYYYKL